MRLHSLVTRRAGRLHLPHRTVRLRLTLLYGALFVLCGAGLLTITYVLVGHAANGVYTYQGQNGSFSTLVGSPESSPPPAAEEKNQALNRASQGSDQGADQGVQKTAQGDDAAADAKKFKAAAERQRAEQMHLLLTQSGIALAIMTVISIVLGWVVAGRILHRLRTITTAARDISATNLHERLALDGPHDELKELGDTFDQLLARLESSFQAQRQFIANASHELRTPLARQRTVAQVALSDPEATVESLREAHERVLAAGAQQERLIAALLTLARGQAGLNRREPVDLARLAEDVLLTRWDEAERRTIGIRTDLSPAPATGDPRLAERVIVNLVDNALRHNVPDGRITITTGTQDGRTVLSVSNTGPVVPDSALGQLYEPFERLGAERTGRRDEGLGLGLSIVRAIVDAHDATVHTTPRPGGGLDIKVAFPADASGNGGNGGNGNGGGDLKAQNGAAGFVASTAENRAETRTLTA